MHSQNQENYHSKSIPEVYALVQSREEGLTESEVKNHRERYGKNMFAAHERDISVFTILVSQFKSTLMIILVLSGVVSGFFGEFADMAVILLTALFNVVIGFVQEYKADKALKELKSLIEYKAVVLRDNKKQEINTDDLVVGDIVYVEAGDKVPADGRIIHAVELYANESALTGESEPVQKHTDVIADVAVSMGDRKNMLFKGTSVTSGRATIIVVAVGESTEIGKIAGLVIETEQGKTPLQKQLHRMSTHIAWFVIGICILLFVTGYAKGARSLHELIELFKTAVAVAVAAIPEGLLISLTVILAIGMQSILKRKALVRRLVAAETLGSVGVICTDKTGTLTHGVMSVVRAITEQADVLSADIRAKNSVSPDEMQDIQSLLYLAQDASVVAVANPQEPKHHWRFVGDSLDVAIAKSLLEMDLYDHATQNDNALFEIPFTSDRKFMGALRNVGSEYVLAVKGAAEVILTRSSYISNKGNKKLTSKKKESLIALHDEMTASGLRVIAVAYKQYDVSPTSLHDEDAQDLIFKGFLAFEDPLRDDVAQTLALAKQAGIRSVMITGDHVKTAQSIARQIGLPYEDSCVFDGKQLNSISDNELQEAVKRAYIFARVDPVHKIRIVRAFQNNGEVVAMTGDGINDAPALKAADIGIALGSGTTVAKESSDIVLLNDSFSTIVQAVKEGRVIYENIKKVILYLLSGSATEVLIITACIVGGFPIAALPAQILWINLVQEAFPNIALAFEKGEGNIMNAMPRKKNARLLDSVMKRILIIKTIIGNVILFSLFIYFLKTTGDLALSRTLVFIGFGIDALFYIFSIRAMNTMIWKTNPFENKYVIWSVLLGWTMLLTAVYAGPLQTLLHTVPLSGQHWLIMVIFGIVNLVIFETIKGLFILKKFNT